MGFDVKVGDWVRTSGIPFEHMTPGKAYKVTRTVSESDGIKFYFINDKGQEDHWWNTSHFELAKNQMVLDLIKQCGY